MGDEGSAVSGHLCALKNVNTEARELVACLVLGVVTSYVYNNDRPAKFVSLPACTHPPNVAVRKGQCACSSAFVVTCGRKYVELGPYTYTHTRTRTP